MIFRVLPVVILVLLVFSMVQRVLGNALGEKRKATLFTAAAAGFWYAAAVAVLRFRLPDLSVIPMCAAVLVFIVYRRSKFWPYGLRCGVCGERADIKAVLAVDGNICVHCRNKEEA